MDEILCAQAYELIQDTANSNMFVQGLSGVFGFPWTLIADGVTLFTHYKEMLNKIRILYHRPLIDEQMIAQMLPGMSNELLFDVAADKVLGNVPVVGIYFNAICAKTMTWRLGILFTMLSARGESIDTAAVSDTMTVIRQMFPQTDAFKFHQPDYPQFEKMVLSVSGNSQEEYNRKIQRALDAFD